MEAGLSADLVVTDAGCGLEGLVRLLTTLYEEGRKERRVGERWRGGIRAD